jgi:hypothetical protein
VDTPQQNFEGQGEVDRLRLDNAQLKQNLEKEEFLHKSLYKQWSELHNLMLAKEREVERLRSGSIFYKYGFYLILFLTIPAYYFLNKKTSEQKISSPSQTVTSAPAPASTPAITAIDTPGAKQDSTLVPVVKQANVQVEKQPVVKADTFRTKIVAANKPVIEAPLTDAAKDSIYWAGWNGYYGKSLNPYKRSQEKYKVWFEGWKDGENDAKKQTSKDSVNSQK